MNRWGDNVGKQRKISIDDKFDLLTVVENVGVREYTLNKRATFYKCRCDCGNVITIPGIYIGRVYKSCGCLQAKSRQKDIPIGTRFERLEVIEKGELIKGRGFKYLCRCDCKKTVTVRGDLLRSGETKSCGCLHDELFGAHKETNYKKMYVDNTSLPKIQSTAAHRNNSTGVRGVSITSNGKYQARITFRGKYHHLGTFSDLESAKEARKKAEEKYFKPVIEKHKNPR